MKFCDEGPASNCHNTAANLTEYMAPEVTASGGSVPTKAGARMVLDLEYAPFYTADHYTWGTFETHEQLETRVSSFINTEYGG